MRQAALLLAALLVAGLLVLLQLPPLCWALGVCSLVLVGLYPLAKRVTWWHQLVMGFTFGFGAPMGYAAGAGRIDWSWAALYAAAILWDLGFDTVYAHQDREDDALAGVRSTARLMGERTRPFLLACYTATIAVVGLAGWLAGFVAVVHPRPAGARGAAALAGHPPRHPRPGRLPAPVPPEPGGRACHRCGHPARSAVTEAFIAAHTTLACAPLVPEIVLHLATEITPIWQATEQFLDRHGIEPPFWAFAWPGSQAMARHVLDHPSCARDRRVLDFAAGGGLAAIACAKVGCGQRRGRRDRPGRLRRHADERPGQRRHGRRDPCRLRRDRMPMGPDPVRRLCVTRPR